jgi:hypothetical protein
VVLQHVLVHDLSSSRVSRQMTYYKVILINSLHIYNHKKLNYSWTFQTRSL